MPAWAHVALDWTVQQGTGEREVASDIIGALGLTSKKGGGCSGVHVNLAEVTSRPLESRMTFKGLRPDVEQRNGSL